MDSDDRKGYNQGPCHFLDFPYFSGLAMSVFRVSKIILFLLCGLFPANPTFFASEPDQGEQYIRLVRNEKNVVTALETAVVHYEGVNPSGKKIAVDLIGVVHIGEKAYYEKLNDLFRTYDIVLYELVTSDASLMPSPEILKQSMQEESNPLSLIQDGMARSLKLEHQLHYIDYTKKNMVHADMDPELLYKRMIEEGELGNMFGRAVLESMSKNDRGGKIHGRLFASLFVKDKSLAFKRVMAVELADGIESQLFIIDGDGSALIAERNAITMEKLGEQIKKGVKKIAVFYGAAHLYDFNTRLKDQWNMTPTGITWLEAWDMSGKSPLHPNDKESIR